MVGGKVGRYIVSKDDKLRWCQKCNVFKVIHNVKISVIMLSDRWNIRLCPRPLDFDVPIILYSLMGQCSLTRT